jgi:hypothetical protein
MAICNGKAIEITRSLYSTLWQNREHGSQARIWADAICVNQNDTTEKTEQIRMMRDIYSRALYVVIWLGELAEDDLIGIWLMKHICDEHIRPNFWNAVLALMRRPWFWRAWVVQEILLCQEEDFPVWRLYVPAQPFPRHLPENVQSPTSEGATE